MNIDETSINRSTKNNYSWTAKGENQGVSNITFAGSQSLITAITSSGEWFWGLSTKTNNSASFIEFLDNLILWLTVDQKVDLGSVILLLDNWSIHKSAKSTKHLNSIGWRTVFLSPYSPDYAAIELFFNLVKRRLWRQCSGTNVRIKESAGLRQIKDWFATVSKNDVIGWFTRSFRWIAKDLAKLYKFGST